MKAAHRGRVEQCLRQVAPQDRASVVPPVAPFRHVAPMLEQDVREEPLATIRLARGSP
jgi:hypothetical protein